MFKKKEKQLTAEKKLHDYAQIIKEINRNEYTEKELMFNDQIFQMFNKEKMKMK